MCPSDSQKKMVEVKTFDDTSEAKNWKQFLESNDISVEIGSRELVLLVPEESLGDANVLIKSQETFDDFYGQSFEEDESE